jgi:hypothetical protein
VVWRRGREVGLEFVRPEEAGPTEGETEAARIARLESELAALKRLVYHMRELLQARGIFEAG